MLESPLAAGEATLRRDQVAVGSGFKMLIVFGGFGCRAARETRVGKRCGLAPGCNNVFFLHYHHYWLLLFLF